MKDHVMIPVAIILSLLGLGTLRYSWGLPTRNRLMNLLGWALIAASLFAWSADDGADRGVAVGLCLFVILALIFILREALTGDKSTGKSPGTNAANQRKQPHPHLFSFKGVGLFLVNVPVLGTIAFAAAMACHELMLVSDIHASDSLVLALFLFPVIWAALVAYCMVLPSRTGKLLTFLVLPALSVLALVNGN